MLGRLACYKWRAHLGFERRDQRQLAKKLVQVVADDGQELDALQQRVVLVPRLGEHPEVEQLVYKVCDGEDIDVSSLRKEEVDYVKTARVLLGQSLYSDSWLEL